MKKAASIFFLAVVLGALSVAQQPTLHRNMTTAQVFGFHGAICTQKRTTQMLEKDPRSEPKLPIHTFGRQWTKFTSAGEIVQEGDFNGDGQLVNLVTRTYDQDGETAESTTDDKKTLVRTKRIPGQGALETETYINDVLHGRTTEIADAKTDTREMVATNATGETLSRIVARESGLVHDLQMWGRGGKFVIHTLRRLDDQGRTIQSDRFDQSGKLVSTMSFSNGDLTSFWQDPLCDCTNVAAFRRSEGVSLFYKTEKDGRLYKDVQNHKGRPTNREIDDEELYDQDGQLLERVFYSYERDAHDNWITRTVSVLDRSTGNIVPIQRDTRELTYY